MNKMRRGERGRQSVKMKQLEYFIKIAECGSISKAAQALYISQPSLTKAIIGLEEDFNVQLFLRKPRGVELTVEGKSFLHYARSVVTAANALETNFSGRSTPGQSRLFIASQQLDFVYGLILKLYQENQHCSLHYNLVETNRNDVTRMVLNGRADIGLLVRSNTDAKTYLWNAEARRLALHVLDTAGVHVCLGPHSPYYHRKSLRFAEVEQCPQILLDMENAATQDLFVDNRDSHLNMDKVIFFNSVSACEKILLETDMVLYVAKWAVGCFRDPRIRVLPVLESNHQVELLWIKRRDTPLTQTDLQFLRHLYRYFGKTELSGIEAQEKQKSDVFDLKTFDFS